MNLSLICGYMELQCIMHSNPIQIDDHKIGLISTPLICHVIILSCASMHVLIVVLHFRCLLLHDR
jgi:hypothetical protein